MAEGKGIAGLHVNGEESINNGTRQTVVGGMSDYANPNGVPTGSVGTRPDLPGSFYDLAMSVKSARDLSTEGESYLQKLTELVQAKGLQIDLLPRTNAYVVSNGTYMVGVLFQEHITIMPDMTPQSRQTANVYKEAEERYANSMLLDVVIVSPTDYDRAPRMARWIDLVLRLNGSAENGLIDLQNMSNSLFRINTNRNNVMQVIDDLSPHGVHGYTQFGYVLEMCSLPASSIRKDYRLSSRDQDNVNWVPILAVGAYVDFTSNGAFGNELKFMPQIHISDPVTLFPTLKLLPVIQSLAVQTFIRGETWKDYFNQFDDIHPNITSLWFDQSGTPEFARNAHERDAFIATRCTPPLLTLDVPAGRASIPGMLLYGMEDCHAGIISQFVDFLGEASFQAMGSLTLHTSTEYTGNVNFESSMVDSRSIDYFKMLKSCNGDRMLLDKFVQFTDNPADRLEAIAQAGFNVLSLYETYMCILNDEALVTMSEAVGRKFPLMSNCLVNGRSVNFSSINLAGNRFAERLQQMGPVFVSPGAARGYANPYYSNRTLTGFGVRRS